MPRVFISYSTDDSKSALELLRALEKAGIGCWIAPRDIKPGEKWAEAIMEAIEKSSRMILLLSERSNNSVQVIREVEHAVGLGVPIIPVKLDDVTPTKSMQYFVSSHQWVEAYREDEDSWKHDLVDILKDDDTDSEKDEAVQGRPAKRPTTHDAVLDSKKPGILRKLVIGVAILFATVITIWAVGSMRHTETTPNSHKNAARGTAEELENMALGGGIPEARIPVALYDACKAYLEEGNYDAALRLANQIADEYRQEIMAQNALFTVADYASDAGDYIEAGNLYAKGYEQAPRADAADKVFMAADCYLRGGANRLAARTVAEMIDSSCAINVRLEALEWQRDYLSDADPYEQFVKVYHGQIIDDVVTLYQYSIDSLPDNIGMRSEDILFEILGFYVDRYQMDVDNYEIFMLYSDRLYQRNAFREASEIYSELALDSSVYFSTDAPRAHCLVNGWGCYMQLYNAADTCEIGMDQLIENLIELSNAFAEMHYDENMAASMLFGTAGCLFNVRRYNDAREMYMQIYEGFPESGYRPKAADWIAYSYEANRSFAEAAEWLAKSDSLVGEVSPEHMNRMLRYEYNRTLNNVTSNGMQATINELERIANDNPNSNLAARAYYDIAELYQANGRTETAIDYLESSLESTDDTASRFRTGNRIAYLNLDEENYELAAELYLEVHICNPGLRGSRSLFSAAAAYELGNFHRQAVDTYMHYHQCYPEGEFASEALFSAARSAINGGYVDHAVDIYANSVIDASSLQQAVATLFSIYNECILNGELSISYMIACRICSYCWVYIKNIDDNIKAKFFEVG